MLSRRLDHHRASRRRSLAWTAGLLALALAGSTAGPAGAASQADLVLHVEVLSSAPSAPAEVSATASSPGPCADRSFSLLGGRWTSAYQWSFRAGSTPAGLNRTAAETAIRKGFQNIARANNDCGRADRVAATVRYLGTTSRKPSCRTQDGHNVVGFRSLPSDMAARACWWTRGDRIVEADVQVNSSIGWATSLAACRGGQLMLEAVMTHEAGHVFGVGHVGEKRHGRLTMSTFIDGPCQNGESTLGLGDMLALERLYP